MSLIRSDSRNETHNKPVQEGERKLSGGIYVDYATTAEVIAAIGTEFRKNKYFWINGYRYHCGNDGTTFRIMGDALAGGSTKTVQQIDTEKMALTDFTFPTVNLIDKSKLIGGSYGTNGNFVTQTNWVCTPKIAILPNTNYVVKGFAGNLPNTVAQVCFYTSSNVFISYIAATHSLTPISFVSPATAAFCAMNCENTVGAGSNPTQAATASTMMLAQTTDINIPYSTYGAKIDGIKIVQLDQNKTIIDMQSQINFLLQDYAPYSYFNGTNSTIDLTQTYTLANDGDYLEFLARPSAGWTGFINTLGMFGSVGSNYSFGIYDNTTIYMRNLIGNPYIIFTGLPPMIASWRKIKVQVAGGATQWQLYVDGALITTQPKDANNFIINNVGHSYQNTATYSLFDLQYFNISVGGTVTNVPDPSKYSGALNVVKTYDKTASSGGAAASYAPIYASYNPTGYNGRQIFTVFVRRGISNYYIGHQVTHEYDMSEVVYMDLFRITRADEYLFDGTVMTLITNYAIAIGESECVYQNMALNKADFTGGFHGDELYDSIQFFINGVAVDMGTAFTLLPGENAHYTQKSRMCETANLVGGTPTPVAGHPVEAIHYKKTIFGDSGYTSDNDLVWQKAISLFWYHGICCYGKLQATFAYDEVFTTWSVSAGNNQNYNSFKGNHLIEYYNPTNKKGGSVTASISSASVADNNCNSFITDRTADTKYYRQTPTYTSVINQKDSSIMIVIYS